VPIVPRALIAILGPTATGKSALGISLAERFNGEIINCDSTAVYRGFDIGTDKVPFEQRRGIAHHLIDIADPTDEYTAAQFGRDAAAVVDDIHARGRLPILVGGTGLYYRALTRGLFPGPGKDAKLRARLEAIAVKKGVETLHRMVARVDPESGARIQPRDLKRLVRALEVYFQTGKPLTAHFQDTVSPLAPDVQIGAIALRMPALWLAERLAKRVDEQFDAGLIDEIRALLAAGVPADARPFGGLVYRQAIDYLNGVRSEGATRELIAQENRKYARRQLIWFRKEPNLVWFDGPGTNAEVQDSVIRELTARDLLKDGRHVADT
jgi:tRNA dimethylallyltransferase